MPDQGWRSHRAAPVVAVAAVVIAVSALFIVLGIRNQAASEPAILPPIMPTANAPYASSEPKFQIPAAFTAADDARARIPLSQPEVHWVFADGPNFPPLVSPCGGYLPSDAARVGAHQLALVSPMTVKLRRVVVYRDVDSARRAMSERRSALQQCARRDDGNGIATVWIWQSLQIGDEAMAVGSQRYRGSNSLPGHQRGVVMRQGRTLVTYFDSGQSPTPPTIAEIGPYATVAKPVATELAAAPWNQ
ncbi:MAG: hypothetical protein QOH92_1716 [Chloroflexota bacterium]|jgi:hypothetical protein|nr:hypothetical protein [Chloroflexota bacterium]